MLYISNLSRLVFTQINSTCEDFKYSFDSKETLLVSGLVVWAVNEVEKFGGIFRNQLFLSRTLGSSASTSEDDFSTVGSCIEIALHHAALVGKFPRMF